MIRTLKNCLRIVDLELVCIIGILPHERTQAQRLVLHAELDVDFSLAKAEASAVVSGVDYAAVAAYLKESAMLGQFGLLEDLLNDLAYGVMAKFPALWGLTLRASKPDILQDCRGVEAEIQLSRRPLE